jgi:hypothetical protein
MPGPIRKPLFHPLRTGVQITPTAIKVFTEMRRCVCSCAPIDWDGAYWERGELCDGCRRYWNLHGHLHKELRAKPWQWPVIERPTARNPYPAGSAAAKDWRPDERGRELWRLLEQAARPAPTPQAPASSPAQPSTDHQAPRG